MSSFQYSEKFNDDEYEYRIIIVPRRIVDLIPTNKLLSEKEVKELGVLQSPGWEHFTTFELEPSNLIFRRKLL